MTEDQDAELAELWSKGVDVREAWKELAPIDERIIFDNLDDDPEYELVEEVLVYQARLLDGLRQGKFVAIGRTGPEENAGYRMVPPSACYKRTLIVGKGCVSSPNLNMERVVVILEPPKAAPVRAPISEAEAEECQAELARLETMVPRMKGSRGRPPNDTALLAASKALLLDGVRIHRITQQRAIDEIILWLQTHKPDEFPLKSGKPSEEGVRQFVKRFGIGGPINPINPEK